MPLEMLANSRAERLIPPRDLRCRIFHRSFGRFQPSRAVPVTVALAWLRTVFVVISPDRVAGLALQRFLHDQPRRPSINAVNSSRVRCEAGNLVAMGCSFAGLAK